MKLVATKSFTYAGRRIAVGDVFDVGTNRDVKILVGIKNARHLETREETKIPVPSKELLSKTSNKLSENKPEPVKEEKQELKNEEKPETPEKNEPTKEDEKEKVTAIETPEKAFVPNPAPTRRTYKKR